MIIKKKKQKAFVYTHEESQGRFWNKTGWDVFSIIFFFLLVAGFIVLLFCCALRFQVFGWQALSPWFSIQKSYGHESFDQITKIDQNVQNELFQKSQIYEKLSTTYSSDLQIFQEKHDDLIFECEQTQEKLLETEPDLAIKSDYRTIEDGIILTIKFRDKTEERSQWIPRSDSIDYIIEWIEIFLSKNEYKNNNINIQLYGDTSPKSVNVFLKIINEKTGNKDFLRFNLSNSSDATSEEEWQLMILGK